MNVHCFILFEQYKACRLSSSTPHRTRHALHHLGFFLCAAIRGGLLLVGTRQACCYTQTENIEHFK
jgi:hypothetical protein